MANALRLTNAAVNAEADAFARLLDTGYLRIYSGTQPSTAIAANADFATASAAANNPTAAVAKYGYAEAASASAVAEAPAPSVEASAGVASASAAAFSAIVTESANAFPGTAVAATTANDAAVSIAAHAEIAGGVATANDATVVVVAAITGSGATAQGSQRATATGLVSGAVQPIVVFHAARKRRPAHDLGAGLGLPDGVFHLVAVPEPRRLSIVGHGATEQASQVMHAEGIVSDDDFLFGLDDESLLGIAA